MDVKMSITMRFFDSFEFISYDQKIDSPKDGRLIHVICRFKTTGHMTILTVYALTEE